jgi:hypothetical protein
MLGARRNLTPPRPGRLPQVMRSNRARKAGLTLERSSAGRIDMLTCGAPRVPSRAARRPADIPGWAEAFADQDPADVPAADPKTTVCRAGAEGEGEMASNLGGLTLSVFRAERLNRLPSFYRLCKE